MKRDTDDLEMHERIDAALARTSAWLDSLQASGKPRGVSCISAAHDPVVWPGVLLYGTYNAVMLRALLGSLNDFTTRDRAALKNWLLTHRQVDGVFRVPGMTDDAIFKKPDPLETRRYIDFHVTNYSLGAIELIDPDHRAELTFVRPFLEPIYLKAWLADRDLRDPWLEGNNIVNLASFLLLLRAQDAALTPAVDRCMGILFDWHDRLQEPGTGFWGVGQALDPQRALHAMAGSMHNFHLWYATGRALPHQDKAIDWSLTQAPVIDSACIDVDLVELLVHGHQLTDHRRADIEVWLRTLLPRLLDFQLDDGGFPDLLTGTRRQDGWVRGYEEPQGLSNTFSTWFRWLAIALIDDCLWPGRRNWQFRRMIGIGYRRLA